jgi:hypothetical protein
VADGAAIAFASLRGPSAGNHATHDLALVAEAADRGGRLPGAQAVCPDCLALHADLVLLAAALPASAVPARPRDYTLSAAEAARLRPAGWRRWLAAIGTSRDAFSRPLAIGLTTLGLAGLLVASVPGALPSGAATSGAAPVEIEAAPSAAASGPVDTAGGGGGHTMLAPVILDRSGETGDDQRMTPMLLVSGSMIVAGTGLLLLRWRAVPAAGGR